MAITLFVILWIASFLEDVLYRHEFIVDGVWGLIVYIFSRGFGSIFGKDKGIGTVVQQGIGGFLYLEILDASFSFDGVVGAFSLSNNIFVIVTGLSGGIICSVVYALPCG